MIDRAHDEVLLDLAAHLGYDTRVRVSALEPRFWQRGNLRLFITHLANERSVAAAIQERLSQYHISSFAAHKDIEPTREWLDEIELALNTADALLALLHTGFKESNWTDQETGFALGRGLLVITVRYGQDPYGFLGRAQAVEGEGKDFATLADEVFHLIRKHKQTRRTMAEALIQGFETSWSFAAAKSNLRLIEENDYWGLGFADRLEKAVEANDQISKAFGVPARVAQLVLKRRGRESRDGEIEID
jgi:TIR domain